MRLPELGMNEAEIQARLSAYRSGDLDVKSGKLFAFVYDAARPDLSGVAGRAMLDFVTENGLDPTSFPSLLRLENDLVGIAAGHLGGDEQVVGSFTSGGTESCMLAVKAARDMARARNPGLREPEMLLPVTAHAAFHKAAHYLGVKVVRIPVDPLTFQADVHAVWQRITPQTILIVGSAVSYAHGVLDPIEELGKLALSFQVPLHVDGCIGGFLLPYLRRLGVDVPAFDFSVPGVTSISMDFHKYAYCPKGASVVLYRNAELRKHQIFACADWTGYAIVNPTMQSSKSGGPLAAAWASMHYLGDSGYLELARQTLEATRLAMEAVLGMPELRLLGQPCASLLAVASDSLDIFEVADELNLLGWHVQPQLGYFGSRPNFHLSMTARSLERMPAFLVDLERAVAVVKARGDVPPGVEMLALAGFSPEQLSPEMFQQLLVGLGVTGAALPERMAPINRLLNNLPPELTGALLASFADMLYRPTPTEG